jgi:hypothetical protein
MLNTYCHPNRKNIFIKALKDSLGVVSFACHKAKVGRTTYYRWFAEDEVFKEKCLEIIEETGDFVEYKLLQKIKDNDTTSIIFYCKTKLKNRGYIERLEQTGKDGESLSINQVSEKDKEMLEHCLAKYVKKHYTS